MKKKQPNTNKLTTFDPSSLIQPGTQKPFPLELSAADWLSYFNKLAEAMRAKTNSQHLSACERERFDRNCELIRRVNMADEIRNYVMLEIHEAKQWRADFRNVVELAKSFGISKSQFYKAIKSAEINIQMAQASLFHLRPKGRHVEMLGKIDKKHRVDAWSQALQASAEKASSDKAIERVLDDYRDRLANKDVGVSVVNLAALGPIPVDSCEVSQDKSNEVHEEISWISELTPAEERIFECLMSLYTWHSSAGDPHMSRGQSMAFILAKSALEHSDSADEFKNEHDALLLAISKDLRLKHGLWNLGLKLIAQYINDRYAAEHPL